MGRENCGTSCGECEPHGGTAAPRSHSSPRACLCTESQALRAQTCVTAPHSTWWRTPQGAQFFLCQEKAAARTRRGYPGEAFLKSIVRNSLRPNNEKQQELIPKTHGSARCVSAQALASPSPGEGTHKQDTCSPATLRWRECSSTASLGRQS